MQNIPNHEPISAWKMAIVMVCFCVFLFGLHAKLIAFDPLSLDVTADASSNPWTGNQKMEAQVPLDFVLIAWLSSLLILGLHHISYERLRSEPDAFSHQIRALGLHRFLRPPPSRA